MDLSNYPGVGLLLHTVESKYYLPREQMLAISERLMKITFVRYIVAVRKLKERPENLIYSECPRKGMVYYENYLYGPKGWP